MQQKINGATFRIMLTRGQKLNIISSCVVLAYQAQVKNDILRTTLVAHMCEGSKTVFVLAPPPQPIVSLACTHFTYYV